MVDAVPALLHVVGAFDVLAVCELDDCFEGPEFGVECEFSEREVDGVAVDGRLIAY